MGFEGVQNWVWLSFDVRGEELLTAKIAKESRKDRKDERGGPTVDATSDEPGTMPASSTYALEYLQ
jgi:hypothetical protein